MRFSVLIVALAAGGVLHPAAFPQTVTFPASHASQPLDGRLLLLLSNNPNGEPRMQIDETPKSQMVFGITVDGWQAGQAVTVDDTAQGYPRRHLSEVPPGEHTVQAVLNIYRTFHRSDGKTVKLAPDLMVLHPEQLHTKRGISPIVGTLIVIRGIVLCAAAGKMREKDGARTAQGFALGLLICVLAGIFSPMLNFSFAFGDELQQRATAAGATRDAASNAIWPLCLTAGLIANAGYVILRLERNQTWRAFRGGGGALLRQLNRLWRGRERSGQAGRGGRTAAVHVDESDHLEQRWAGPPVSGRERRQERSAMRPRALPFSFTAISVIALGGKE